MGEKSDISDVARGPAIKPSPAYTLPVVIYYIVSLSYDTRLKYDADDASHL